MTLRMAINTWETILEGILVGVAASGRISRLGAVVVSVCGRHRLGLIDSGGWEEKCRKLPKSGEPSVFNGPSYKEARMGRSSVKRQNNRKFVTLQTDSSLGQLPLITTCWLHCISKSIGASRVETQ